MRETDLYLPVKILFNDLGYEVVAEVGDIDVLATKGEEFIVIELKKELNLRLITQGALRQKMSGIVYVAVPKPSYKIRTSKIFIEKAYLLKRLGIGLIFVDFKRSDPIAMIEEDPLIFNLKHSQNLNKKIRERMLKEKSLRSGDYNMGGQKGRKITAYKENVLLIVGLLSENGVMKVSEIRTISGEKTGSILQKNYYGYFNRVKMGYYELTEAGTEASKEYSYIIRKLV